jgi:hypothetical protein
MTAGLTALFSPVSRYAAQRSGQRVQPAMKELRVSRVRPGFSWGTGHARGGGEQRKLSESRRGMNRSCAGSKKLLLHSCCTHGFTAVL